MSKHKEIVFEDEIVEYLTSHGDRSKICVNRVK